MHEELFGWKSLLLHLYNLKQEIIFFIIFFGIEGLWKSMEYAFPGGGGGGGGTLGISGWDPGTLNLYQS